MQMEMITDIQIDLYGEMQYYMVSAKQGDKATRYIRVQLMNNGNEFQIPDDVIIIANIKKPDGKFCYNECTKSDNRVMVQLTNQALAAAGTACCDIEMRSENGELILSSAAFTIEIESSMRNENAIESSNEMTFLDRKFEIIEKIRQEVEKTYADFVKDKEEWKKLIGNTDISDVGDGTLTGAIIAILTKLGGFFLYPKKLTQAQYDALPEETKNTQGLIFVVVKE